MQNSIAAGRRLAFRVVCAQLVATLVAAAGFLLQGGTAALGALSGGGVVVVATSALAMRMFAAGPSPAATVFARLIVGNLLKWTIVASGLYLVLARAGLPPLPVLCGMIAALVPQLLGLHEWFGRRA